MNRLPFVIEAMDEAERQQYLEPSQRSEEADCLVNLAMGYVTLEQKFKDLQVKVPSPIITNSIVPSNKECDEMIERAKANVTGGVSYDFAVSPDKTVKIWLTDLIKAAMAEGAKG